MYAANPTMTTLTLWLHADSSWSACDWSVGSGEDVVIASGLQVGAEGSCIIRLCAILISQGTVVFNAQ